MQNTISRVLITGITGHLGRELAAQLLSAGAEVHGVTRQTTCLPERHPAGAVTLHQFDGRTETLVSIVDEIHPDTVFHLAAQARREHHREDVVPFVEANVLLGAQLLEAMRSAGSEKLITAGSYLQHFDTERNRAFNLYAATKQAFESLLAYYVDAFGFSAIRLTLGDIYSEQDTRRKLMTDIRTAWRTGSPLSLQAEEAWIDPVHVEDAAGAFLTAAALPEMKSARGGSLFRYSVTSGGEVSTTELIGLFEQIGNKKLIVRRGQSNSLRRMKPWRGKVLPGWTPKVSLEAGIQRIIDGS